MQYCWRRSGRRRSGQIDQHQASQPLSSQMDGPFELVPVAFDAENNRSAA